MNITNEFVAGTKAKALEVNQNFNDCKDAIDTLEGQVSVIEDTLEGLDFVSVDGSKPFTGTQAYPKSTITGATNATPIVLEITAHGRSDSDQILVDGIVGNTAPNGKSWTITKVDDNHISLDGSVGNGTYTSGGVAYLLPKALEDLANKAYVDEATEDLTDKDLSTLTATGKNVITSNIMPDYANAVSKTPETWYTTSKDCIVTYSFIGGDSGISANICMKDASGNFVNNLHTNNGSIGTVKGVHVGSTAVNDLTIIVPKGYQYKSYISFGSASSHLLVEIPLKGAS